MTDAIRASRACGERLDLPVGTPSRGEIRTARKHSLFVRYLRTFIVVGCSLAVLALGIAILFDPFKRVPRNLSVGNVGLQGSTVILATPKMKGFRQDGQPFELTGVSGTQDILKPNVVKLNGVDAKIGLDDASTARITANTGTYDSSEDVVWLRGNVRIENRQSGYDMRIRSASLDFKSSRLVSEEPVLVLLNGGSSVAADAMDISENGHKISFQGEVRSVIDTTGTDKGAPSSSPDSGATK